MNVIQSDNTKMQFVYLHAFPLNAAMWEQQKSVTSGQIICPNLYGFGSSLEEWATSVLDLTASEEQIVVIGSSMGGSCAIEMARQAPSRIAALVLVGTKAGHRPEPSRRDAYIEILRAGGINAFWPEVASWFGDTMSQELVEKASLIACQQDADELINAVNVFHNRCDLECVLRDWKKPYLVISGDQDPMFPMLKSQRISRLGPYGQFSFMLDCGHFANMEHPEDFNLILSKFVATVE